MIDKLSSVECTGCNVCVDACPVDAINLSTDIEGFWYPHINKEICTSCEVCEKKCPVLQIHDVKKNDFEKPISYAAIHKNLEVRFDSTSGGLFSALAENSYRQKGYVGGAIYNDDFSVKHYISNEREDLEKLRSSKYLQSNTVGFYKQVKELLKSGEKVLICGTPCQMAGVKTFLNKDYENLIIVDFICRGINSPKVHDKYLKSLEKRYGSKVVHVKAKSKELGWKNLTRKIVFQNGESYYGTKKTDPFGRGYLKTNAYCRPACYDCKFKGFPRISDITLADFWGIDKFDKSFDDDIGTSMVLVNSRQGEQYFNIIKPRLKVREVPFETILPGNPALTTPLAPPKIDRDDFFKELDENSFDEVAKKYFPIVKTKKQKLKEFLGHVKLFVRHTQLYPRPVYQFFKYNFFHKGIKTKWKKGALIYPSPYCVFEISKKAQFIINGRFIFGAKRFKRSKLESRLLVEATARFEVNGDYHIDYGSDVEVFKKAQLIIKGGGGTNINTTIICGDKIVIGEKVSMGREVTIRDNNGGHTIALQGYKNSRGIIIGDRVWLCSGATIMPGVKIKNEAIVGANSFVVTNVPARCLVSGFPAKIAAKNITWKK